MKTKNLLWSLLMMLLSFGVCLAQSNTYPFKVKITGNGAKNLIFIPGFMSSVDVWNETISELSSNYNCYTIQFDGFAGQPAQGEPSLSNWKASLANYIQKEKIKNPIIIGHSLGGVMALDLASTYPDLMQSIVVVDALPSLSAAFNPNFKVQENLDCTGIINQFTGLTDEQFKAMQEQTASSMSAIPDKQKEIVEWSLKSDRKASAKIFCEFNNTDLRTQLAKAKVPALIMLNSRFGQMKEGINSQYAAYANKDIQYAPTPTHFLMYDAKDWYLTQLRNFIK